MVGRQRYRDEDMLKIHNRILKDLENDNSKTITVTSDIEFQVLNVE